MAYNPTPWNPQGNQGTGNPVMPVNDPTDTWRYGSPGEIRRARVGGSGYGSGVQYNIPGPGGGGSSGGSESRSQTTTRKFTGDMPKKPDMPDYVAPEYDKERVKSMTQREAAPGVRRLRETVQQVAGAPEENPNVKRMTLRSALQGYGTGLEQVMSGAARTAQAQYQQELNLEREEAYANWKADVEAEMAAYNAAMQAYMGQYETHTEAGSTTGGGAGETENFLNQMFGKSPFSLWNRKN